MTSVSELAGRVLATPPRLGSVRLVCVDGPAGSGKTTLADRLATALAAAQRGARTGAAVGAPSPGASGPADVAADTAVPGGTATPGVPATQIRTAVVHLDDLYEGWSGLDGVWERLAAQVLDPLDAGLPARYQRYDWLAGRFGEWVEVAVPDVLVVEGCGSAPRAADGRTVLVVWVEAPAPLRLRRGLDRDGEPMRAEWERWMDLEARHFAREDTRRRADVVVDGTRALEP